MEGFKNSTRMTVMSDAAPQAYAKGGSVKAMAKVGKVMSEFGAGKLHSGSKKGPEVTNKKQAVAIALSEARKAGAKFPIKREGGGSSALTRAEREAMMEETSRPLTAAQQRAARAVLMAKAAAPKREPLLPTRVPSSGEMQRVFGAPRAKASLLDKLSEPTGVYSSDPEERKAAYVKGRTLKNPRNLEADPGYMTAAERRRIEMDRPTNSRGAEGYKNGGKISKSATDGYRIAGDIASRDYDDLKKVAAIPAGIDIDAEGPYRYKTVSKLEQMAADDTHKRGGKWGDERLGSVRMKYKSGDDAKKWAFAGTKKERSALRNEDDKALSSEEGAARSKRLIDM